MSFMSKSYKSRLNQLAFCVLIAMSVSSHSGCLNVPVPGDTDSDSYVDVGTHDESGKPVLSKPVGQARAFIESDWASSWAPSITEVAFEDEIESPDRQAGRQCATDGCRASAMSVRWCIPCFERLQTDCVDKKVRFVCFPSQEDLRLVSVPTGPGGRWEYHDRVAARLCPKDILNGYDWQRATPGSDEWKPLGWKPFAFVMNAASTGEPGVNTLIPEEIPFGMFFVASATCVSQNLYDVHVCSEPVARGLELIPITQEIPPDDDLVDSMSTPPTPPPVFR